MPVETEIKPLLEWLLGEDWWRGALMQTWLLSVLLAVVLLAVFLFFVAARRRPESLARWISGTVVGILGLTALGLLAAVPIGLVALFGSDAAWERFRQFGANLGGSWFAHSQSLLGDAWWQGTLYHFAGVILGAAVAITMIWWVVQALRSGPRAAVRSIGDVVADVAADLAHASPRRVAALGLLAVKESLRRKVLVVFVLFVVVLLFAGWFLDPTSDRPARLYLDFVLSWATAYPLLLLALFLSAWSLPADIKSRTLHTVVTKPVRSSEILLGRVLGFMAVGTVLLAVMGAISYVFVVRGLSHRHEISEAQVARAIQQWQKQAARGEPGTPVALETTNVHNHRHTVYLNPIRGAGEGGQDAIEVIAEGRVGSEMAQEHWHPMTYRIEGDLRSPKAEPELLCKFGAPQGHLIARVPKYGKLRFKDRTGEDVEKGINVGDEWTYRSFVEGGGPAAAIWEFEGISEEQFPEGLPLELAIEVFRTHKGDTSDPENIPGVTGSLSIRNPETGLTVDEARVFTARDFVVDRQFIPRELQTAGGDNVDLFRDLVTEDGRVEIWLQCITPQQYFGAAQADLYIRARDAIFWLNYVKGYFGVWLQMLVVVVAGTVFSTFLSGPVAIVATAGALLGGIFVEFMGKLAVGETYGGGPFESFVRLLTQQNVVEEMAPGMRTTVVQSADVVARGFLWVTSTVLPGLKDYSFARHVAYGYDVSGTTLGMCVFQALAFLVPVFLAGCFFLRTREVAR
jgi:hypothetical protein